MDMDMIDMDMRVKCESNTLMDQSQILDRLNVMRKQEMNTYQCSDYLRNITTEPGTIDAWCRYKMVEWSFQIIDFVDFQRETVCIAMSYLDRFLATKSPRALRVIHSRKEYQLAAMAAVYTAIKVFEPKVMDTALLAELSRGCYTAADFKRMELDMLFDLNWRVNGPTAISFVEHYLALLPLEQYGKDFNSETILDHARYQIELSVADYDLMTEIPSSIAIGALANSVQRIYSAQGITSDAARILKSIQNISETKMHSSSLRRIAQSMERLLNDKIHTICRRKSSPSLQEHRLKTREERQGDCSPNCVST